METNVVFETYVTLVNDDNEEIDYKVEVEASGEIVEDGFSHEFGFEQQNYIDGVKIDTIYNLETEELISFRSLSKKQQKELVSLAEDYLNDTYSSEYTEEEHEYRE